MDDRTQPSVFIIVSAIAAMLWAKSSFAAREPHSETSTRRWNTVGGCAFTIYLLQDMLIAQSRYRFFVPMSSVINPFAAVLFWEASIFAVAFGIAWLLKKVPLLQKLI